MERIGEEGNCKYWIGIVQHATSNKQRTDSVRQANLSIHCRMNCPRTFNVCHNRHTHTQTHGSFDVLNENDTNTFRLFDHS
mmetsp:Transcript_2696/g.5634  ORF Transcript_2696/g.5634 Transcript_2696/m.5634 type:complete len:81 (+) Transcript_2696:842-1084(+)